MRDICLIPVNQKHFILSIFLLFSSPAFASCPSGYQEATSYSTREFKLKWDHESEYSTCLSINNPEKNTIRGGYGLGFHNINYQCGTIHLERFNFENLYVQPSNKSLDSVIFQLPLSDRNSVVNRQWCEQAGADIYCYEESVSSPRYFPLEPLVRNGFIYSKDIKRLIRECKLISF